MWFPLAFLSKIYKLSLTKLKHNFKKDMLMFNISEIVKKTEEMFDLFNKYFYQGELTRPAITVSPDGGRGAYGWCSIHEIWNASNELYREIGLCAEYLDRPITEIAATLLHEMSHLYNLQHDIRDVSNNVYYHNMKSSL